MKLAALLLLVVACAQPPVVDVTSPPRESAPGATLLLEGWHAEPVETAAGTVYLVLPGALRHEVRGDPQPPTVAVAAQGGAGVPSDPLGLAGLWPLLLVALGVVAVVWWTTRPKPIGREASSA